MFQVEFLSILRVKQKISWAEILLFFRRKKKDEKESQPRPLKKMIASTTARSLNQLNQLNQCVINIPVLKETKETAFLNIDLTNLLA